MTKIDNLINDILRGYDDDDRFEIKVPGLKRILVKFAEDIQALQSSEVDVEKIMEDLVSVNPSNHSPFPYYPPYIREILSKHLSTSKVKEEVEISDNLEAWYKTDCPSCGYDEIHTISNYCGGCGAKIKRC